MNQTLLLKTALFPPDQLIDRIPQLSACGFGCRELRAFYRAGIVSGTVKDGEILLCETDLLQLLDYIAQTRKEAP